MKLMLVGAGGIGGYLSGMLGNGGYDFTLVARGATLEAIQKNGLTLSTPKKRIVLERVTCTDKPEEYGIQDAVIICTKGYGLDGALDMISPCVNDETLIIPMLNGVNAHKRIAKRLKTGVALDGCIYVFSRVLEPGIIEQTGSINSVYMGIPGIAAKDSPKTLIELCKMLNSSGVNAQIPDDIEREMWIKWTFICSNAQATSYFDVSVGELREDPVKWEFLLALLDEILLVAAKEGIDLPADLKEKNIEAFKNMAYESRSSLSRDLKDPKKPTELSLFAGELVRLAQAHGLEVPYNRRVLERFKDRL
ncbi:MAG TPA: 2-dehydropantoate 2-reductase [Clostridia bacterium]|nr:2-dehydropantoate 2-reductase [Clostridia bacterium]HOR12977.1 2-dehydropantoate 2-reductase [Clostridia bacterium]